MDRKGNKNSSYEKGKLKDKLKDTIQRIRKDQKSLTIYYTGKTMGKLASPYIIAGNIN